MDLERKNCRLDQRKEIVPKLIAVGRLQASCQDRPIVIDCQGERIVVQFAGLADACLVWRRMPISTGQAIKMADRMKMSVHVCIGRHFPIELSSQHRIFKWLFGNRAGQIGSTQP